MSQFPKHVRPYINDIIEGETDGNYGVRVIASLHAYG